MGVPVLAPEYTKTLFDSASAGDVSPIFYRLRRESLSQRISERLGLVSPVTVLARRLHWSEKESLLPEARALWLSPNYYLPPAQAASLVERMPKLRWIYSQVTGTDHMNLEFFRQRGIMLSNTGTLSSRRVAELALACILSHAKRLPAHRTLQRQRRWRSLPCADLSTQVVGILGTGNIGRELALLCRATGMRAVGASRNPQRFESEPHTYHEVVRLDRDFENRLAEFDHVIICLPAAKETRHLIKRETLNRMKRGASLINVSRGEVVDEKDLCRALNSGHIGAAYIDRPSQLPPPVWSRMYRTRNLYLTHNSSANSPHVLEGAFHQFIAGVDAILAHKDPPNRVA